MRKATSSAVRVVVGLLAIVLIVPTLIGTPASAMTPPAPGNFTGYGFDACSAPSQTAMDAWNLNSPFSAIGIYISGRSRYCGDQYQSNLTKAWVATNAANGWRFLPIHVGYQSPCFHNSSQSSVQKLLMSRNTATARKQAASDAGEAIAAAKRLGFATGNTLYLDLEYYRHTSVCDAAVLEFEDAWTESLHRAGYLSGLYSSGSAAIKLTDSAVAAGRADFTPPDQLWIAWTNGKADTAGGPFVDDTRWANHQRIHQYQANLTASYGGVKISIDRDYLDIGRGTVPVADPKPCGVEMSFRSYPKLSRGARGPAVAALQCLLKQQGLMKSVSSSFGAGTQSGVARYQARRGWRATGIVDKRTWISLLTTRSVTRLLKFGASGRQVWGLQRSLRAAGEPVTLNGLYDAATSNAVLAYRKKNGLGASPTVVAAVWDTLVAGKSA